MYYGTNGTCTHKQAVPSWESWQVPLSSWLCPPWHHWEGGHKPSHDAKEVHLPPQPACEQ